MSIRKLKNIFLSMFPIHWLLLTASINGYSQLNTCKIYLKKVTANQIESGYDYQFVNQKDTAFVAIKYHGDFGKVDYATFSPKDKLPDGVYNIYIDAELRQELFYKNRLKNGLWTKYYENGEKEILPMSKGKIKGKVFVYFKDGSLKSKSYFTSKGILWRISYSDSGKIKIKEYFRQNRQYKIERFNNLGKIIETKDIID